MILRNGQQKLGRKLKHGGIPRRVIQLKNYWKNAKKVFI